MVKRTSFRTAVTSSGLIAATVVSAQTAVPTRQLDIPVPAVVSRSTDLGPTDASMVLHIGISIPLVDAGGLQRFVDAVSDPKSPAYRQFLTPEQIGQRFGAPASSVQRVASYLTASGFKVKLIAKSRMAILADATVGQVEAAFGTRIDEFATFSAKESGNLRYHSFATPLHVPASIAGDINGITGLDNFSKPHPQTYIKPTQFPVLYGTAPILAQGRLGQGRTIAVSNFDGFDLTNVPTFLKDFGLPTPAAGAGSNITVTEIDGGSESLPPAGEGDLDIQCVLAAAPLCNLLVYDAGDSDLFDTLVTEENDNLADVITESWGWNIDPEWLPLYHSMHTAMSAQGITYICASGDQGTAILDPTNSFYPDVDPDVLTVGGTTVTVDSFGNRVTEFGWSGSGGGWSTVAAPFNVLPPYQTGSGMPTGIPFRLVPDVALDADPNTGYYYVYTGTLQQIGGTSGASPTFAGSLAVAEQQLISSGGLAVSPAGKRRFGRLQDLIYSFNGDPTVFFDVINSPATGTLPNGSSAVAGPGWDFVTGLGAMNFDGFVDRVLGAPSVVAVSASPSTLIGGNAVKFTVNLSGAAPTGGATVQLSASDPVAVPLPTTLVIAAGAKTGTVTVTTGPAVDVDDVVITAALPKGKATTVVTVTQATVSKISFSPSTVIGGGSTAMTGTVTIAKAAPAGGVLVTLRSSSPAAAAVPGTVTVVAGATTAAFPVTTSSVATSTAVSVTATSGGAQLIGKVTVNPPTAGAVSLAATTLYGGSAFKTTGTVTLTAPAPTGGTTVTLTSGNPAAATVSASTIVISAGAKTGTFTLQPIPVSKAVTFAIQAVAGGVAVKVNVTVNPATLKSIALSATTALGGVLSPTLTITLNAPAGPSGNVVTLSSSATSAAMLAASVSVPSGATTATVPVTTLPVSADTSVTLTATSVAKLTTALTVQAALLQSFTVSAATVKGGTSVTGTLTLAGKAGPSGRVVALSSSNTAVATVPPSVTVPANATSVTFTITTKKVTANATAVIKASLGSTSPTQTLTITP